jgi:hypothetical protein
MTNKLLAKHFDTVYADEDECLSDSSFGVRKSSTSNDRLKANKARYVIEKSESPIKTIKLSETILLDVIRNAICSAELELINRSIHSG